jgi:hypothetical protein
MAFTWCRCRRSCLSSLCLIYLVCSSSRCLCHKLSSPLGAPLSGFIYATRLGFTSVLVEYGLEPSFFVSKSILESLYLSTFLMGRTRYTNQWVPEGHIHVTRVLDLEGIALRSCGFSSLTFLLYSFMLIALCCRGFFLFSCNFIWV